MTDAELVGQALSGQSGGYAELVRRWAPRILAICHARVHCINSAEDLAQEALLRAYQALPTLNEHNKFGAWLRGIAIRACLDWRKAKQTSQVPFSVFDQETAGSFAAALVAPLEADALSRSEETGRLMAELTTLPEEYREVLLLYYYDEVTYQDLAELLGVSRATINARLTKARALLRQRLGVG